MKRLIVAGGLFLLCGAAFAQAPEPRWEAAFDFGRSTDVPKLGRTEFDIYRVALRKDFKRNFWEWDHARVSGYWEASLNYWDADDANVYAAALSPVFVLFFTPGSGKVQPYLEFGIGAALISDHSFAGREMSTNFQFEDRLGLGVRTERWDFHYRFMHYSNGGIEKPNNGFDANVIGATFRF